MTKWELFTPTRSGNQHGSDWNEFPCVGITRSYLTLNAKFVELYCANGQTQVELLGISSGSERMIGIKVIARGDEHPSAFNISTPTDTKGLTKKVSAPKVCRSVSDLRGKAFRVHKNPASQIIEVDLSPGNLCK